MMAATTSTDIISATSSIIPKDNANDDNNEDDPSLLPLPWFVVAVVLVSVAIVTAVGGNLLVLLSYRRDRGLRDVHNLYLLHLAVCDLMIGAFSMPFYLIYTVLYWTWPLGRAVCKFFLVEDYTVCCMSSLVVVLVAADRLALLTLGSNYQVVETRKRAYIKLSICWTWSFLLYSPAILFWGEVRGHSIMTSDECDTEFYDDLIFTTVTEVISFSTPLVILAILNCMLFVFMKKRRKVHAQISGKAMNMDKVARPQNGDDRETLASQEKCSRKTYTNNTAEHSSGKSNGDSVPFCVKPVTASQQLTPSSQTLREYPDNGNDATASKSPSPALLCLQASALSGQSGTTPTFLPKGSSTLQTSPPSESHAHIIRRPLSSPSSQSLSTSQTDVSTKRSSSQDVVSTNQSSSHKDMLTNQSPGKIQSANHSQYTILKTNQSPHKTQSTNQSTHKVVSANQSSQELVTASHSRASSVCQAVLHPWQTIQRASSKARGRSGRVESNPKTQQKVDKPTRRAGAILAVLVIALIVFSLPYGITTILVAACDDCVNEDLYEVFIWLLWLRSCFNPFLYAYKSPRFRRNFQELLSCVLPRRLRRKTF